MISTLWCLSGYLVASMVSMVVKYVDQAEASVIIQGITRLLRGSDAETEKKCQFFCKIKGYSVLDLLFTRV